MPSSSYFSSSFFPPPPPSSSFLKYKRPPPRTTAPRYHNKKKDYILMKNLTVSLYFVKERKGRSKFFEQHQRKKHVVINSSFWRVFFFGSEERRMVSVSEKFLSVRNLNLAGKLWRSTSSSGKKSSLKIMCLHGWLDNANSFDYVAPELCKEFGAEVFALDFCGHGKSEWLPNSSFYYQSEYAAFALGALDELGWGNAAGPGSDEKGSLLIGHSMGAGVASIIAGSFPERFSGVVLLDGVGPVSELATKAPDQFRTAYEAEGASAVAKTEGKTGRVYENVDAVVNLRQQAVRRFPGQQRISSEAARKILERGTKPAGDSGVCFVHDPRLSNATPIRFNEENVKAFLENIKCPTTAILAHKGWPSSKKNGGPATIFQLMKDSSGTAKEEEDDSFYEEDLNEHPRLQMLGSNLKTPLRLKNSYHHLHLDPDTRTDVTKEISSFFRDHVINAKHDNSSHTIPKETVPHPPDGM